MSHLILEAHDATDTTSFPLVIDSGKKIVYQLGHMTADKGLKLYYDTIPVRLEGQSSFEDSLRPLLSPE